MVRRGVDDAGVDGRTAQPHEDEAGQRERLRPRQKQGGHTHGQNGLPQTDHLGVVEPEGDEAAEAAPHRDAQIEQARKGSGRVGRDALAQREVAAGPEARRRFEAAVAEEAEHHFPRTGDGQDLGQRQRPGRGAVRAYGGRAAFPERQAQHQNGCDADLDEGYDAVATVPALPAGQGQAHQHRADDGAHAPHAVQPAHVAALVVEGNVVVQGGVHASGTQPVGDGPEAEHPERARH